MSGPSQDDKFQPSTIEAEEQAAYGEHMDNIRGQLYGGMEKDEARKLEYLGRNVDSTEGLMRLMENSGALSGSSYNSLHDRMSMTGGPWQTAQIMQNTSYADDDLIQESLDQDDKFTGNDEELQEILEELGEVSEELAALDKIDDDKLTKEEREKRATLRGRKQDLEALKTIEENPDEMRGVADLLLELGVTGDLTDDQVKLLVAGLAEVSTDPESGKLDTIKLVEELKNLQLMAASEATKAFALVQEVTDENRDAVMIQLYGVFNGKTPTEAKMIETVFEAVFKDDIGDKDIREYLAEKVGGSEEVQQEVKDLPDGLTPERMEKLARRVSDLAQKLEAWGELDGKNIGRGATIAAATLLGGWFSKRHFVLGQTELIRNGSTTFVDKYGSFTQGLAPVYMGMFMGGLANAGFRALNKEDYSEIARSLAGLSKDQIGMLEKYVNRQNVDEKASEKFSFDKISDRVESVKDRETDKERAAGLSEESLQKRAEKLAALLTTKPEELPEGADTPEPKAPSADASQEEKTAYQEAKKVYDDAMARAETWYKREQEDTRAMQEAFADLNEEQRAKLREMIEKEVREEQTGWYHYKNENEGKTDKDKKPLPPKMVPVIDPETGEHVFSRGDKPSDHAQEGLAPGVTDNLDVLIEQRFKNFPQLHESGALTQAFNPDFLAAQVFVSVSSEPGFWRDQGTVSNEEYQASQERVTSVIDQATENLTKEQAQQFLDSLEQFYETDIDLEADLIKGVDADTDGSVEVLELYRYGTERPYEAIPEMDVYKEDISTLIRKWDLVPEEYREKVLERMPNPTRDVEMMLVELHEAQLNGEFSDAALQRARNMSDDQLYVQMKFFETHLGEAGVAAFNELLTDDQRERFGKLTELGMNAWMRMDKIETLLASTELSDEQKNLEVTKTLLSAMGTKPDGERRSYLEQADALDLILEVYGEDKGNGLQERIDTKLQVFKRFREAATLAEGLQQDPSKLDSALETFTSYDQTTAQEVEKSFNAFFAEKENLRASFLSTQGAYARTFDFTTTDPTLQEKGMMLVKAVDLIDGNDPKLAAESLGLLLDTKERQIEALRELAKNASTEEERTQAQVDIQELGQQEAAFTYLILSRGERFGLADPAAFRAEVLTTHNPSGEPESNPINVMSGHGVAPDQLASVAELMANGDISEALKQPYPENVRAELQLNLGTRAGFDRKVAEGAYAFHELTTKTADEIPTEQYEKLKIQFASLSAEETRSFVQAHTAMYGEDSFPKVGTAITKMHEHGAHPVQLAIVAEEAAGDIQTALKESLPSEVETELRYTLGTQAGYNQIQIRAAHAFNELMSTPDADFDGPEYDNVKIYLAVIEGQQMHEIPDVHDAMYGAGAFQREVNEFLKMERERQDLLNDGVLLQDGIPVVASGLSEEQINQLEFLAKPREEREAILQAQRKAMEEAARAAAGAVAGAAAGEAAAASVRAAVENK